TSVPISTGERLVTKYEFARVLETGAASILQPALGRVGGLWEAKKIAAMAEPYTAQMAPHLYAGPIEAAANIHLAASIPNFLILESIERFDGPWGAFLKTPIRWEEGYVIPPTEPGLGIELDEDRARAHPYTDAELHLEMSTEAP
ncbi:MAG: enolase C-terminal domain-like protein, partial [Pseudomonadota bacterium]